MIVITAMLLGAITGAVRARRGNGSTFDIVQYVLVHAIIFAILGVFLTLAIDRMV